MLGSQTCVTSSRHPGGCAFCPQQKGTEETVASLQVLRGFLERKNMGLGQNRRTPSADSLSYQPTRGDWFPSSLLGFIFIIPKVTFSPSLLGCSLLADI